MTEKSYEEKRNEEILGDLVALYKRLSQPTEPITQQQIPENLKVYHGDDGLTRIYRKESNGKGGFQEFLDRTVAINMDGRVIMSKAEHSSKTYYYEC